MITLLMFKENREEYNDPQIEESFCIRSIRKEVSDDELKKATAGSLETAQQEAAMSKFRDEQDLHQAINCAQL
eukprot:scaffold1758_cov40-Cyclotella_meneghiniana.AAC.10